MVKRRVSNTNLMKSESTPVSSVATSPSGSSTPILLSTVNTVDWNKVQLSFKNPNFKKTYPHSIIISGKKRQWKALKQIITQELTETSSTETSSTETSSVKGLNYGSIDAPPSFKPAKKYSDISGLEANYTDPQTKLNYSNAIEFKVIKKLPSDLIAGYLTLRRANIQLQ